MSRVLVVNESHVQRTPDGRFWNNGIIDYSFFKRYLEVFEEVLVAIRVKNVSEKQEGYVCECGGERVTILPLPDYEGLKGYLSNYFEVNKLIRKYSTYADCAILRAPTAVSFQFLRHIDKKIPYALEVAVDPWYHLAPGNYDSHFRALMRISWTMQLKKYCKRADGVSYVTKSVLQKSYPCKGEEKGGFSEYYSTVSIDDKHIYEYKKYKKKDKFKLLHVGNSFNSYIKGQLDSMDVVKKLLDQGKNVNIEFVGDGKLKKTFEEYARKLGIWENVSFVGHIGDKKQMFEKMRATDILLLPTHSEGLPRVIIESMYVGTPCVATDIVGIPELLDESCMAGIGDTDRMAGIVRRLIENPDELTKLSKKGIDRIKEYMPERLQERRRSFYEKLNILAEKEMETK